MSTFNPSDPRFKKGGPGGGTAEEVNVAPKGFSERLPPQDFGVYDKPRLGERTFVAADKEEDFRGEKPRPYPQRVSKDRELPSGAQQQPWDHEGPRQVPLGSYPQDQQESWPQSSPPPAWQGQATVQGQPAALGKPAAQMTSQAQGSPWATGLYDCFEYPDHDCVCALMCPCCTYGKNQQLRTGGGYCSNCCAYCCVGTLGTPLLLPVLAFPSRQQLRTKYQLEEEPCSDLVVTLLCSVCALCQENRELRYRRGELIVAGVPPYSDPMAAPVKQSMT